MSMTALRLFTMAMLAFVSPALGAMDSSQRSDDFLVAQLIDDDIRWNATHALGELLKRGVAAEPVLREALSSQDWQQRQLAAHVLQRINAKPDEELIRVSIEGLKDDRSVYNRDGDNLMLANAQYGYRWLRQHPEHGRDALRACLGEGADPQQRFIAALLLGLRGDKESAARICAIVIPHLASNDIPNDGRIALSALAHLGPSALPYIQQVADNPLDMQQAAGLNWLLKDPEDRPQILRAFSRWHKVHHRYFNMFWWEFNLRAPLPLVWNDGGLQGG